MIDFSQPPRRPPPSRMRRQEDVSKFRAKLVEYEYFHVHCQECKRLQSEFVHSPNGEDKICAVCVCWMFKLLEEP